MTKHPLIVIWFDVFSFPCDIAAFLSLSVLFLAEVTRLHLPGVVRTHTDVAGFC